MAGHIGIVTNLVFLLVLGGTADFIGWENPSDSEEIPLQRYQFGSGKLADILKCYPDGCPPKNSYPYSPTVDPYYPPTDSNPKIPREWLDNSRKFGGRELSEYIVRPGQIPYMVSIRVNGRHICSGSIINKRYVLTSATCFLKWDRLKYNIKYGITNLKEDREIIPVSKVIKHEHFGKTRYNDNDIALLQLSKDMDLKSNNASAVKLPVWTYPYSINVDVFGWENIESSVISDNLMRYHVHMKPENICGHFFEGFNPKYHMCAGDFPCCQAEYGAPMILNGHQYGVGSYLPRYRDKNIRPWVFTKVANYVPWIQQHSRL